MREQACDVVDIEYRFAVDVDSRCGIFILADHALENAGKFDVAIMAGTGRENMSAYKPSNEREIAYDIEQFVARGLIVKL